eukprot:Skav203461  [mRNA]  locus=scaffold2161:52624:57098:+ [translate_table: standard]
MATLGASTVVATYVTTDVNRRGNGCAQLAVPAAPQGDTARRKSQVEKRLDAKEEPETRVPSEATEVEKKDVAKRPPEPLPTPLD